MREEEPKRHRRSRSSRTTDEIIRLIATWPTAGELLDNARKKLEEGRAQQFTAELEILLAPTLEDKKELGPSYLKGVTGVIEAAREIGTIKVFIGKPLTDPEVEERVRRGWENILLEMGANECQAVNMINKSIRLTYRIQERTGARKNPH